MPSGKASPLAKVLLLAGSIGLYYMVITLGGVQQPLGFLIIVGLLGLVVAFAVLIMRALRGAIHRTVRRIVDEEISRASKGPAKSTS